MGLSALDNPPSQIQRQWFQTGDLLSASVKSGGPQIDRDAWPSPGSSLKEGLLSGRVKVLTQTDLPEWRNKEDGGIRLTSIILSRRN